MSSVADGHAEPFKSWNWLGRLRFNHRERVKIFPPDKPMSLNLVTTPADRSAFGVELERLLAARAGLVYALSSALSHRKPEVIGIARGSHDMTSTRKPRIFMLSIVTVEPCA